jgi:hypothetical protein
MAALRPDTLPIPGNVDVVLDATSVGCRLAKIRPHAAIPEGADARIGLERHQGIDLRASLWRQLAIGDFTDGLMGIGSKSIGGFRQRGKQRYRGESASTKPETHHPKSELSQIGVFLIGSSYPPALTGTAVDR